ncbi:MAG: PqqD family protein [Chloroflexota bacterium]|nr:PqqD family protein [Chloroflexota bacterium]
MDVKPNPDVVSQELEGELVLVHLRTNRIYVLNETGGRFWELLSAGHSPSRIHRDLSDEFDVDPAQLEQEVDALIERLAREGLITRPDE